MSVRRPPFWATIFTLASFILLCGLGVWQIKRLQWKEQLIAQMNAALTQDPMNTELSPGVILQARMRGDKFLRGFIEGGYLHDKEVLVGPRTYDGKNGYYVITPFESYMSDDVLLVNRGWIPADLPHDKISHPSGNMILQGTATAPPRDNKFTPDNVPAKGQWYSIHPHEIAEATGLRSAMPYILYPNKTDSRAEWPKHIPFNGKNLWNHHKQYALFWFSMALALLVMFYFRFMHEGKGKAE